MEASGRYPSSHALKLGSFSQKLFLGLSFLISKHFTKFRIQDAESFAHPDAGKWIGSIHVDQRWNDAGYCYVIIYRYEVQSV